MYKKREGVLCKFDMEKAYNHVNWSFLGYLLMRMEFRKKWRKWIKTCMPLIFAVMVNEGVSSFFKTSKGLRAGRPIVPLVFYCGYGSFE